VTANSDQTQSTRVQGQHSGLPRYCNAVGSLPNHSIRKRKGEKQMKMYPGCSKLKFNESHIKLFQRTVFYQV